jgi:uncharacterized protein YbjT (DUF2867 family)
MKRTILITGVTGNQGGAVAQALQRTGFCLRGLTRTPDSDRAAMLAHRGVDMVKGDLDEEATLRRALAGAWGVFGVQNTLEAGVEREEAQGKRLATLAREAGVEHYVYTSVGSAHKRTGIPHFDNKWRIEETVRGLGFPSHVILRPVFFMENLLAPYGLQGNTLAWALGPGTKLQMIAVDDIGWFGARAFTDAAALNRREIDLAGDSRTMPEAAEILTEALGRPIAFAQTPIEQVRHSSVSATAPTSRAWNASSATRSRSSPTGPGLEESSHESCQRVGIRWAAGVQRGTGADDRTRRDLGEGQEYRRQSSGSRRGLRSGKSGTPDRPAVDTGS